MQLAYLVRKDFLLAKKYWWFMLVAAFGMPLFIQTRAQLAGAGFIAFFLSTLYIQYLLFNLVSVNEHKYRGETLLCAAPYTRGAMVLSKYMFLLVIFFGCWIASALLAIVLPGLVRMPNLREAGGVCLFTAIIFGLLIPVQYRFGYEKSRMIFMVVIILMPFVLPLIIRWVQSYSFSLQAAFPFSQPVGGVLLLLAAAAVCWTSMEMSLRIYTRQNV